MAARRPRGLRGDGDGRRHGVIVGPAWSRIGMTLGPLHEVVRGGVRGRNAQRPVADRTLASAGGQVEFDVAAIVADVVGLAFALMLALLMTFFFLRDGPAWWEALLARLMPGRREPIGLAGERGADLLAAT